MQTFADSIRPQDTAGWSMLLADSETRPGWVFQPVGRRLLVAVTPWPEYGAAHTAAWEVKAVRVRDGAEPTRRYWLWWSSRLGRWTASGDATRLQRDLAPDELRDLDNHMRDVLEGALC